MAIIVESKQEHVHNHTRGWKYVLQCDTCKRRFGAFSTAPEFDTSHCTCIKCEADEFEPPQEPTTVTNMAQVFDEHLAASLPVTIIDQLENLPHLRRLGSNNLQRLQAIMDLMRHPNNMLQLWVWTRMSWAFGRCNAALAHKNFTEVINNMRTATMSDDPEKERQAQEKLILQIACLLDADAHFPQWKEYNAFMSGIDEDDPNA